MDIFEITTTEPQTHLFKTDNVKFQELGLGVFTTGILYEYFNELNSDGQFANRDGVILNVNDISDIIGEKQFTTDFWGSFQGFRRLEYTGQYEDMSITEWNLSQFGQDKPYSLGGWFYEFDVTNEGIPNIAIKEGNGFKIGRSYFYPLSSFARHPLGVAGAIDKARSFLTMSRKQNYSNSALNVIAMNDFMISLKSQVPRSKWKDLDSGDFNKDNLFAMDEYLSDIKSSKTNSIMGSGEVTFNIEMAGGKFQCPVKEWVSWELMLRDQPTKKKAKATAVISNQLVADYKKDETNRSYKTSVDGTIQTPDKTKESEKTVAPMELTYNAYKDKWQSGTASIMGYCNEFISAAPYKPDLEVLASGEIDRIINDADETQKVTFASGLVMPVHMQNGNPYQWAPNYAKDEDCRGDDVEKQKVLAFNFNPKKSYEKGDMVILSEIGGVWHIQDPGIGQSERVVRANNPQWAMTYHMTNRDYFFRVGQIRTQGGEDLDPQNSTTTPSFMERYHHLCYYKGDTKNGDQPGGVLNDPTVGRRYNDQFDTSQIIDRIVHKDGVLQITSFDFMDTKLFGTRGKVHLSMNKNALNTTQAALDAFGRTIPLFNRTRNAAHSGPFFGCVFPEGYEVSEELKSTGDRDFNILYHNSGAVEDNVSQGTGGNPAYFTPYNIGESFFTAFNPAVPNSGADQHPFIDPKPLDDNPFDDERPKYAVGERSDARSAVNVWGDEPFDAEQEQWYRLSPKQGPSMFQLFTDGTDKTLNQLPADIATNAHIDDANGGPLWDAHRTSKFYADWNNIDPSDNTTKRDSNLALSKCAWLRKRQPIPDGQEEPTYSSSDSAFGFKPKRTNAIQFRPLKMELYAAFNEKLFDPVTLNEAAPYWAMRVIDVPGLFNTADYRDGDPDVLAVPDRYLENDCDTPPDKLPPGQPKKWCEFDQADRRASWGCSIARHYISNLLPVDISGIVDRESKTSVLYRNGVLPYMNGEHLDFFGNTNGFRYHNRWYWSDRFLTKADDPTDDLNPFYWQDSLRYNAKRDETLAGGSAIGVISAVATTTASTSITLKTKNYFGMASVYWSAKQSKIFSFPEQEIPSWGGAGVNTYKSHNTYHLATTVYHSHPRKQTVLDNQYFAVHHYNPRPDYEGYWTGDGGAEFYYNMYDEPVVGSPWPFTATAPFGDDFEVTYALDISGDSDEGIEAVGIREPSFPPAGNLGYAVPVPANTVVFRDGVATADEEGEISVAALIPEQYAHLNITRIGKLLPYRYKYRATTFPAISTIKVGDRLDFFLTGLEAQITEDLPEEGESCFSLQNRGIKFLISNFGKDYVPGDKVGDNASGLEFTVSQVGPEGDIVTLSFPDEEDKKPENIPLSHGRTLPAESDITRSTEGFGVTMTTISSENGKDFGMMFFFTENREIYGIDQKPRYLQRELKLSADADATEKQIGYDVAEFGFVNEDVTNVVLVTDNPSPNGKYDMFFQAHNDTIFTWFNSDLVQGYYNEGKQNCPADEQFIELTFTGE